MAIPVKTPAADRDGMYQVRQLYLESLLMKVYETLQRIIVIRNAQYEYLQSRNPRVERRQQSESESREQQMLFVDSDLSRTPLPDLVLSAIQQMPPPPPQVTASAPNSPTRDATFQFPECPVTTIDDSSSVSNPINESRASSFADTNRSSVVPSAVSATMTQTSRETGPVATPRPKPRRRRLTSEGSLPDKAEVSPRLPCNHSSCCATNRLPRNLDKRELADVGANLRSIADEFHADKKDAEVEKPQPTTTSSSNSSRNSTTENVTSNPTSSSTESLLSTLRPPPFRDTLWTTIALYLGWRLVSHLR